MVSLCGGTVTRLAVPSTALHVPSASQSEGKPLPSHLAGWHWCGACLGFASGTLGSEEPRNGWCPLVALVCSDEHYEEHYKNNWLK